MMGCEGGCVDRLAYFLLFQPVLSLIVLVLFVVLLVRLVHERRHGYSRRTRTIARVFAVFALLWFAYPLWVVAQPWWEAFVDWCRMAAGML